MIDPVLIDPEGLYDDGALRHSLGLTPAALARARRAGTLRYARQGKRTLYKGAWVLAWLESEAAPMRPGHRSPEASQLADGQAVKP